ncbi:MAG: DNA polymerase III subunit beta [Pirellulales bacterium]|nr:DNA polymerase III subunit beta [Pirellulales bacterium]
MKTTEEIFSTASEIARRFNSKRFFVFGSAIDPSRTPHDIDFACEGVPGWKLFQFGAALEEALRMPVDLIPLDEPTEFGRMVESRGRRLL